MEKGERMTSKTIKGNYRIIDKMKCEHDLVIIEEEYFSEICVYIILECRKCKSKFKGVIYKEGQTEL